MMNEIDCLKELDHPNILRMYESYECEKRYYIVTDISRGGELFDEIAKNRFFTEPNAQQVVKALSSCIAYLHDRGLMHRDLKPENILLEDTYEYDKIKLIDFGEAAHFVKGVQQTDVVGTPYYIAPEVLKKSYDEKCDMWSIGVITYILLSGTPPFGGRNEKQIMQNVQIGKYNFDAPSWQNVSKQGKDFVAKLLTLDPEKRMSAKEAMGHPWMEQVIQRDMDKSKYGVSAAFANLKSFNSDSNLKKATYTFISQQLLSKKERDDFLQIFNALDTDHSGSLSKEEFLAGSKQFFGESLPEKEVLELYNQADIDQSGTIEFGEFVTAAMKQDELHSIKKLQNAFNAFDTDKNGSIDKEELMKVFEFSEDYDLDQIENMIKEVDDNGNGQIEFEEFKQMMTGESVQKVIKRR